MTRDEDFSAYMGARWTKLVRSAVLLGCSPTEAEDTTQTALARCYASWDKVAAAADMDAYVYRVLVNCFSKSRKRRWWAERPTEVPLDRYDADPAELAVQRHVLRQALKRLAPEHRTVLVLRFTADLSVPQVADVLGIPVGTVKPAGPGSHGACRRSRR